MKALLLIHGFATDHNDFARLAPILSARYDEVCCPDLPAHGEGKEKEAINHALIMDFILNTFDKLSQKHKTIDVIGFSMGGALASHLAGLRPVNRLILLAPANKYLAPAFFVNTVRSLINSGRHHKIVHTGKIKTPDTLSVREMFEDIGDGVKIFRRIARKYTPKNLAEFGKVIKCCNLELKDICVPTLIIWGKIDQLVPFSSVKHVVGYCRHDITKIIVYPDVSHLMLYSRAHYRITDDILKFLQQTDPLLLN